MSILNRKNVYATIENHIVFVETFKTTIIRETYEKLELAISKERLSIFLYWNILTKKRFWFN